MPFDFERLKKLAQQAKLAKQRASAEEAEKQEEHKRALRAACIKNARERAGQIIRGIPAMLESAAKDAERSTFIKLDSIQPLDEFQFRDPFTWKEWHDTVDRVVFEYCDGEGLHPEFRTVDVGINTRGTPHRTLAILRW